MNSASDQYVPALGRPGLTPLYDAAIRLLTRERAWRSALIQQIGLRDGERLLDVGCGTGSLAIRLKRLMPGATVVGLDPDPKILAIAAGKAKAAGVDIEWREGFARSAGEQSGAFDKVVSSLVFHQVPLDEKAAGMEAMVRAARIGGSVHIADYARQRSTLMRGLFRVIQRLDGYERTQPNADGVIEQLLEERQAGAGRPTRSFRTPTGEISLFRMARKDADG